MPYQFQAGKMYRMPTHFGPSMGPRQADEGTILFNREHPKRTSIQVSFETNPEQLNALLPEGFELLAPIVTISVTYMKEIVWLAGRGYNILGVSFPARFNGERDQVKGDFLTVLWENLADPIITGREELGVPKIWCEIPEPAVYLDHIRCTAGWLGFKFMDLRVENIRPATEEEIRRITNRDSAGLLNYKYMPRTEEWGKADVEYVTLTPKDDLRTITEVQVCDGTAAFHKATWEDLPTLHHIVNTFSNLEIRSYVGASIIKTVGGNDVSNQRILC